MNQNKINEINLLISLGVPLHFKINYKKPKHIIIALKALFGELELNFPQYFLSKIDYDSYYLCSHLHLTTQGRLNKITVNINLLGLDFKLEKGHHIDEFFIHKIQRQIDENRISNMVRNT